MGGGFALFTVALFFHVLNYIYMKIHLFPKETTIRMHGKEKNMTENHTTPMVSEIHTKLSI
jgi:hypothetical protein